MRVFTHQSAAILSVIYALSSVMKPLDNKVVISSKEVHNITNMTSIASSSDAAAAPRGASLDTSARRLRFSVVLCYVPVVLRWINADPHCLQCLVKERRLYSTFKTEWVVSCFDF